MSPGARIVSFFKRYGHHAIRPFPLALIDAAILLIAYACTYSVRAPVFITHLDSNAQRFIGFALIANFTALYGFGAYHRIWWRTSGHDVAVLIKAVTVSTAILAPVDFLLRPRPIPLSIVLFGQFIALTGFVAVRYRSRLISGLEWRWRAVWRHEFPNQTPKKRVLIVGAGEAGSITALRLKHRPPEAHDQYEVVGFVDDDPNKLGMFVEGSRVLGNRKDIPALVEKHNIELIVVAVHNISGPDFIDVLTYCEQTSARINTVPDVLALFNGAVASSPLREIRPEDLLGRKTVSWHEDVDVSRVLHKTILVTGAAGSIGSELCRQLLNFSPVKLIMVDNNESGLYDLLTELRAKECDNNTIVPVLADITHRDRMSALFAKFAPQVIFHAAAYKHVPMLEMYPAESVRVNIGGTRLVAELACQYGAERFILISNDKAVNPTK